MARESFQDLPNVSCLGYSLISAVLCQCHEPAVKVKSIINLASVRGLALRYRRSMRSILPQPRLARSFEAG